MADNKNNLSKSLINSVRKTIKDKFPELNNTDIIALVNEAIEAYNEYNDKNPNLKIKISNFLIFYVSKMIEQKLSKKDMLLIMEDSERYFLKNGSYKSYRKTEQEKIKNEDKQFLNLKEKLCTYTDFNTRSLKRIIRNLSKHHPEISMEIILSLISDSIDEEISDNDKKYNVIEYCIKNEIDFFMMIDMYLEFLASKPDIDKNTTLLNVIYKANIAKIDESNTDCFYVTNLSKELRINENAFRDKLFKLKNKFPLVQRDIILKSVGDYYYIKHHDKKLLELMKKIKCSYRDNLILEIVLLRMEQVLTYEDAYEIAVKNLENGTPLLYLKYGDHEEEKIRDIYSKK